jgi:YD repeat-containing protein
MPAEKVEPPRPRLRRVAAVAGGVGAALILGALLMPAGEAPPPPEKASQLQERALTVCEAVAFSNQTGGLPSKPTVLPPRASSYYAFLDEASRSGVVTGLIYLDNTVSLCRPVGEPGDGSPKPRQRELPLLGRGETYAYDWTGRGLVLIGERAPDGTVTRYAD